MKKINKKENAEKRAFFGLEFRADETQETEEKGIVDGYAIIFEKKTDICGMFSEIIKRGALEKTDLKDGKKHRDNGKPALITYRKNGTVKRECYFVNGKIDETKDVYATEYFSKHTIKKQSFSIGNGYTYTIKFGADGNKRKIVCLKDGKKHNAFGPAEVEYNSTGEITEEYFYLDGVMVDDMTFMIKILT